MALRAGCFFRRILRIDLTASSLNPTLHIATVAQPHNTSQNKVLKTESNLFSPNDPDKFGTLSGKTKELEFEETTDEGDKNEERFLETKTMNFQKLSIKQYSDLIKQHIEHKQIKEAIDILEIRMLKEDRVKPENYIYNILIGACAEVGYTQKAFKLYNDMKKRGLKVTGDTYTCLYNACANSPWPLDGIKRAKHLRELMQEKQIEPNLTNYNAMIKAFGRCGDLPTAFEIADEMRSKGIKIRVHTFNFLLQACITDKENGLRHGLIVWRKMLDSRERPNIYTFNLILRCIKECHFGTSDKIEEIVSLLKEKSIQRVGSNQKLIESKNIIGSINITDNKSKFIPTNLALPEKSHEITENENTHKESFVLVDNKKNHEVLRHNWLAKIPQIQSTMIDLTIQKPEDKFSLIIGNQENFLNEMQVYSVLPDIKTFTQLLAVLPGNTSEENQLLELMKKHDVRADIDFYNMLIKKRCIRECYADAKAVRKLIEEDNALRRKKHFLKKKLFLKPNLFTYGVLAMTCKSKEDAESLLKELSNDQLKVNIEVVGAMLHQATANFDFGYVLFIMNTAREEELPINQAFLNHLKTFNDRCRSRIGMDENGKLKCTKPFAKTYGIYRKAFERWLNEVNLSKALNKENPWTQFKENQPETIQRPSFKIEVKKRKYKPKRFVKSYNAN